MEKKKTINQLWKQLPKDRKQLLKRALKTCKFEPHHVLSYAAEFRGFCGNEADHITTDEFEAFMKIKTGWFGFLSR
jgi:hypothetical protein